LAALRFSGASAPNGPSQQRVNKIYGGRRRGVTVSGRAVNGTGASWGGYAIPARVRTGYLGLRNAERKLSPSDFIKADLALLYPLNFLDDWLQDELCKLAIVLPPFNCPPAFLKHGHGENWKNHFIPTSHPDFWEADCGIGPLIDLEEHQECAEGQADEVYAELSIRLGSSKEPLLKLNGLQPNHEHVDRWRDFASA
jgi:hypothetical protein